MTHAVAPWRRRFLFGVVLFGGASATACEDATGPALGVPALAAFPLPIPTLPTVMSRMDLPASAERARELWIESWRDGAVDAALLRTRARDVLAEASAGLVDERALGPDQEALDRALIELRVLLGPETELESALARAEEHLAASRAGHGPLALVALLEASDQVLALPLQPLAEGLLACADREPRRNSASDPYAEVWRTRALHLREGAGEALDKGNLLVAVRRAYYGCRLLAGPVADDPGPR